MVLPHINYGTDACTSEKLQLMTFNVTLAGNSILARPVTEAGASTVDVYLPGGSSEYWYDIEDFRLYQGTGNVNLPVTLDKVSSGFKITLLCFFYFACTTLLQCRKLLPCKFFV